VHYYGGWHSHGPLKLMGGGGGALLVRCQTHTLLHDCPGGVVLEVEQVLRVPGQ
jgi:hypothetical protein